MRLLTLVCLFFSSAVFAGSGPASLSCKGVKIPLTLRGEIPASEEALDLTLSDSNGNINFTYQTGSAVVVEDLRQGVFTLVVLYKSGEMTLHALPKTVKSKPGYNSTKASFDGILDSAPKPPLKQDHTSYDNYYQNVLMRCQYVYEI